MKPFLLAALAALLVFAVPAEAQDVRQANVLNAADETLGTPCAQELPADVRGLEKRCAAGRVVQLIGLDKTTYERPQAGGRYRDPAQNPTSGEKPRYVEITPTIAAQQVAVTQLFDPSLSSPTTCTDESGTPGEDDGTHQPRGWPYFVHPFKTQDTRLDDMVYQTMYGGSLHTGAAALVRVKTDLAEIAKDVQGLRSPQCERTPPGGVRPGPPAWWQNEDTGGSFHNSGHVWVLNEGITTSEAGALPSCFRNSTDVNDPNRYGAFDGQNVVSAYKFRNWIDGAGYFCQGAGAFAATRTLHGYFGNSPTSGLPCVSNPFPDCPRFVLEADWVYNTDILWCSEQYGRPTHECKNNGGPSGVASAEETGAHEEFHALGSGHDLGNWPEGPGWGGYRYNLMSPSAPFLGYTSPQHPSHEVIGEGDAKQLYDLYDPCVNCPDAFRP